MWVGKNRHEGGGSEISYPAHLQAGCQLLHGGGTLTIALSGGDVPQIPEVAEKNSADQQDADRSEFCQKLEVEAVRHSPPLVRPFVRWKLVGILWHQHARVVPAHAPDRRPQKHPAGSRPVVLPLLCGSFLWLRDRLYPGPILWRRHRSHDDCRPN